MTSPHAFIFDLDGTLTDNMRFHMEAFARFVERHGLASLRPEDRARFDGKRNRDIFPALMGRELTEDEQRRFAAEKETAYREISAGKLEPVRGLDRLLAVADAGGIKTIVATSAPLPNVEHTLSALKLSHLIPSAVRSDDVPHGKPFPDVFLTAAARVSVEPGECIVFEDAALGIVAAKRASMTAIAMTTTFTREEFVEHGAAPDEAVADFDEFLERLAPIFVPGLAAPARS